MSTAIAFIGLGNMGLPMAKNLLAKGYSVTGFDMSADALAALEAAGGKRAESASAAAMASEVVITMLPAGDHVTDVYLGDGGVMKACQAGTLLIDCSTIDVASARAVRAGRGMWALTPCCGASGAPVALALDGSRDRRARAQRREPHA